MADGNAWSPFGLIGNRLPVVSVDFTVRALQSPFAYLIQGEPGNTAWTAALDDALGLSCPTSIGMVARNGDGRRLICIGPDMWLCMSLEEVEGALWSLADQFPGSSAVDVTETRCWLSCEGERAESVLAGLTSRSMTTAGFGVGRAYGVDLGPLKTLIDRPSLNRFVIGGPTSMGGYLLEMLLQAGSA